MRETSDLYKRLLADSAHVKESRLTIGGTVYDESQIVSLSTAEVLFAEDTMSIGGALAREIDFAAFLGDDVPKRARIIHEVRLKLGAEVSEWLQKGVYYIDTRSRDPLTGVTTVHGFDAMLTAEQEWIPSDTDVFPMLMKDAVEKTAAALGLELDPRTTIKSGDAYMVDYPAADADESEEQQALGLSIRQLWRWVAAAMGGNFIINDLGQLRLVPLNALPAETAYLVTETGSAITFGGVRILLGAAVAGGDTEEDKVFVGNRAAQAEDIPALDPIGRIILKVDSSNAYVSESDTDGLTLEVDCAYGSQQMADDLLQQLQGYVYRPVQAEDALIDPAAELGDGVTINGVYTILAQKDTLWDLLAAADIGAPGEAELESEFRFTSAAEMKFQYKLATTRTLISKNSESVRILAERTDGLSDQFASFDLALDEITLTVSGIDRDLATLELRADNIEASVSSVQTGLSQTVRLAADGLTITNAAGSTLTIDGGQINAENLNLTGHITFNDLTSAVQDDIDEAWEMAYDAQSVAEDAADTVDAWRYNGGTYIDSSMIMVTTLMATELLGGSVGLLTAAERQAGGIDITGASSATYAIELWSNGALRLTAESGAVYIEDGSGAHLSLEDNAAVILGSSAYFEASDQAWVQGHLLPVSRDRYNCGNTNYYWAGVYTQTTPTVLSDRNMKNSIEDLPEKYLSMFDLMRPVRYKLNDGTSGRYHVGYIADEVKAAMDSVGLDSTEFGGWVMDVDTNGNSILMLRYDEYDAIRDAKIKQLEARVAALEE